ncbi:unnamed protein product [Euphydryas editha]|uniref:Uncharacterized protein n=1 Tax=Euphydryas editha TaxID=104508 RepID=A0AAU9UWA2_EUPED|nr:unnamed protein product [Euphydryas editha]
MFENKFSMVGTVVQDTNYEYKVGVISSFFLSAIVIVLLFCAVAGASAGNAVYWPGAIPLTATVKTIIPQQIKAFGYSTSEYINAVPTAAIGYQPQFSYQISVPSYQHYQPVVSASYYPSNNILYPSFAPGSPIFPINTISPVSPIAPFQPPQQNVPSATTEQPAGDEDSAVIESADSSSNNNNQQQFSQQQPQNFPQASLDSKNMPEYPQIPQAPQQFPSYPQIPQFIQQGAFPSQQFQLQQNPSFPQAPSPSPSFPSAANSDKGLIDEDSVAVDSA